MCVVSLFIVPNEAPYGMEAVLLNSSAVFLKWKAPEWMDEHGKDFAICHRLSSETWRQFVFADGRQIVVYKTFDDNTDNDG